MAWHKGITNATGSRPALTTDAALLAVLALRTCPAGIGIAFQKQQAGKASRRDSRVDCCWCWCWYCCMQLRQGRCRLHLRKALTGTLLSQPQFSKAGCAFPT